MRRILIVSLFVGIATLVGTRAARAACSYECSARLVDRSCASAEGTVAGGSDVELIATCSATCNEAGVVASGAVSPTSVPVTKTTGEYGGYLVETARACDGARVYRWTAPVETGVYRLGSRELSVKGVAQPLLVAVPSVEVERPRTPPRDWEDRRGFALEIGAGGVGAIVDRQSFAGGGNVVVGLHAVRDEIREEHGEKFSWPVSHGLRWCTPFGCGVPLLLLFAPADALIGNDRGVDLRAEVLATDGAPMVRLGIQPVMRYARGIARTGTFFGVFLPEIAFVTGGSRSDAIAFAWSPYPVELLVDRRHLAVGFEPLRAGFRVPLDGSPVAGEMRTELSFRWVR